jgi:hypothetical protein
MINQSNQNKIITVFGVTVIPFILAKMIVVGSMFYTVASLLILAGIAFFIPTSAILYLLICLVFSVNWLDKALSLIPRQITWLPDLLILLLFTRVIIKLIFQQSHLGRFPYLWFLLSLIGLFFASQMVNGESLLILIPAAKMYLKYIILSFSLFVLRIDPLIYRRCFKLLTALVLFQVPITVLQAFHAGGVGDYSGGTLGHNSTGLLCVVNGLYTCVFLENYFSSHKKKYLFWALSLFIPAIAGSAKFAFFTYPLIYLYYFVRNSKNSKSLLINIAMLGVLIIMFIGLIRLFDRTDKGYIADWFTNPKGAFEYEMRVSGGETGTTGRIGSLKYALNLITADPVSFLFGYGPASSAESFLGPSFEGKLYRSGAFKRNSMPTLPQIIVELGFIGLGLFLFFGFKLIRYNQSEYLNNDCLVTIVAFFFISSFYTETFRAEPTALVFWLLISFLHVRCNQGISIISTTKT